MTCIVADETDIVLAEDTHGEKYLVYSIKDDEATWSFNDYHEGVLYTWGRYCLGDKHHYPYPEDCLQEYIDAEYQWRKGMTHDDYLKKLRELWNIILGHIRSVEIIDNVEYCKRYLREDSDEPVSPYYAIQYDAEGDKFEEFWLESEDPEDFTQSELENVYDIYRAFNIDDLCEILKYTPNIAFKKVIVDDARYGTDLYIEEDMKWERPVCGCFLCTKDEFWCKEDNWKEKYFDMLNSYVKEWGWLQDGKAWGFRHAKVSDIISNWKTDLKAMSEFLKELSGVTTADELCNLLKEPVICLAGYSSIKDAIDSNEEDSCWGFVREDYSEALQDYLEGFNLAFVKVIE